MIVLHFLIVHQIESARQRKEDGEAASLRVLSAHAGKAPTMGVAVAPVLR